MSYKKQHHLRRSRNIAFFCLLLFCSLLIANDEKTPSATPIFKQEWQRTQNNTTTTIVPKDKIYSTPFQFPGSMLLSVKLNKHKWNIPKSIFEKETLYLDVFNDSALPIHGHIFIKDKNGEWFQTQNVITLPPKTWEKLHVNLTPQANNLRPVGNALSWSALEHATIHSIGLSLYCQQKNSGTLMWKTPQFKHRTTRPKLAVVEWRIPKTGQLFQMLESRFQLTREYFNPFNDHEIRVDVVATSPSGKKERWGAFFTRDYKRNIYYSKEVVSGIGMPYWCFRFTPCETGRYTLHLEITDNSNPKKQLVISTKPRTITVAPSHNKGFVQVAKNPHYFQFSTGELFYPIGFNLHSVRDLRGEKCLKIKPLPNFGTKAYDNYFSNMKNGGINATEIWMASWSKGLEWTGKWRDYYGLGRYNLKHAWMLDHVLKSAKKNGIYIHLVLDNHGKLSTNFDPEWDLSPFNKKQPFGEMDNACLDKPIQFFNNKTAIEFNRQRNRYIAARWGNNPQIFGIELWSEIDLITGYYPAFSNSTGLQWHKNCIDNFKKERQGKQLFTTHTSVSYKKTLSYKKLYQGDILDYIVCDAYRSNISIITHLIKNEKALSGFNKPFFVTEYGGNPMGANMQKLEADLHAGLWTALFLKNAGGPFLWWHDFVDKKNKYQHFIGFSKFLKDIPLRDKTLTSKKILHTSSPSLQALFLGNFTSVYGWAFNKNFMFIYPKDTPKTPYKKQILPIPYPVKPGDYKIDFYNTLTGEIINSQIITVSQDTPFTITLPDFTIDIAFKITQQKKHHEK